MTRRHVPDDDAGLTLVEMMMSAVVSSVVLLVFAAGMVQMYRSAGSTEALGFTQTQLRIALQRLDEEIRYASAIGAPPETVGADGYWHVTYLSGGVCTELRLNDVLQRSRPAGSPWRTLAEGVAPVGRPFIRLDAGEGSSGHQRLDLHLSAAAGGTRDAARRTRTVQFTAVNTSIDTVEPTGCAVSG